MAWLLPLVEADNLVGEPVLALLHLTAHASE
jgi:hypothetical protein